MTWKFFPRVINNSIDFLVTFDINVLCTMNLGQVKHVLLMYFGTVKRADWWVPLATKTDVRDFPSLASLVTTAWPCWYLTVFLGQFIISSLEEVTRSEGCSELVLERVTVEILKWTYINIYIYIYIYIYNYLFLIFLITYLLYNYLLLM